MDQNLGATIIENLIPVHIFIEDQAFHFVDIPQNIQPILDCKCDDCNLNIQELKALHRMG